MGRIKREAATKQSEERKCPSCGRKNAVIWQCGGRATCRWCKTEFSSYWAIREANAKALIVALVQGGGA